MSFADATPAQQRGRDRSVLADCLVATAVIAAFLYANFFLDWLFSDHGFGGVISELEAPGSPNATLLRVTDVVCDVLVLAILPWVHRRLPRGVAREVAVWSTVVFAVGSAVAAIVPLPCSDPASCPGAGPDLERSIHTSSSVIAEAIVFVGAAAFAIAVRRVGPRWMVVAGWSTFWIGGVLSTALFTYFHGQDADSLATGLSQRFHVLTISAWIICLGIYAADGVRRRSGDEQSEGVP